MSTLRVDNLNARTGTKITVPTGTKFYVPGGVVQVQQTVKTDTWSTSSTSYADVTGMSVAITPTSTSSKILVILDVSVGANPSSGIIGRLMRDSTAIYIGDTASNRPRGLLYFDGSNHSQYVNERVPATYLDSPASTSTLTYKLQAYSTVGGTSQYINRSAYDYDGTLYNLRAASSITVMEIGV